MIVFTTLTNNLKIFLTSLGGWRVWLWNDKILKHIVFGLFALVEKPGRMITFVNNIEFVSCWTRYWTRSSSHLFASAMDTLVFFFHFNSCNICAQKQDMCFFTWYPMMMVNYSLTARKGYTREFWCKSYFWRLGSPQVGRGILLLLLTVEV